ncbi:cap-specific mRNA (nucleoside-2'-O-)-methyltransferase 1-like isoform X1 [Daphnia pulicaria]|uniref:cap-specific mRNA (nucleoside-2'-O-)-methyltransferase 1-like isoform X1 n=1 Tax=Daphnia pulicaria TaxID=35523 RepID=UPI001EEAC866|nr:cap-specific mRNA (nucleoside-2'-O-)-methyltransferase 1-like isoform X1 [Daphnia pulicaria]
MASQGKITSLSDSSSDDDSYRPPLKKPNTQYYNNTGEVNSRKKQNDSEICERSTVIVSPSKSNADGGYGFNAPSSSQDSDSSDDDQPIMPSVHKTLIKPKSAAAPVINHKATAMMAKMGWAKGTGLGKKSQGMTQPIEVSKQRGRRGLGLQIKGLEAEDVEWDSSRETVVVEEEISWLHPDSTPAPTLPELKNWVKEGTKKLTIDDETTFCSSDILKQVLQCKSIFDVLEEEELRKARTRSNPFETIRGAFFLNRAAMKMANMDAVFDFMFTDPRNEDGTPVLGPNELLYFADVCAGPGGFSEYILWRKKWEAKGFGFTLKSSNDFKLEDFHAAPCECFEPHYGVGGVEGNGDVYNPENIREFQRFVMAQTGEGVHFMMADGGFSVEGQENLQEILSKRLYLCQFLVALSIVRTGGHFVCKLFDLFTPFSAGLVYLMYRSFKQISIHKPNTSRPANSERYIICKWKRSDTQDVETYLFEINRRLDKLSNSKTETDVMHIVPLDLMTNHHDFYNYLFESNNDLGERQVVNLAKIAAFCKDVTLREDRQSELKKQSLEFWKIPEKTRTAPSRTTPVDKSKELLTNNSCVLDHKLEDLDMPKFQDAVKSVHDWRCVVLGLEKDNPLQAFFLGLGRNNVFRWDATKCRWLKLVENVELARDTLIFGELIQELRGEGRSQKRSTALHVIDAVFLGGVDVSKLHLKDRSEKIRQFCKALNRVSRTDLVTVRAKENFKLEDVEQIFHRLTPRILKNSGCQERLVFCLEDDDQRAFLPSGLMLYKATKSPWMLALSKSSGRKYWFHVMSRTSVYDCPQDSVANYFDCHKSRIAWWWKNWLQGSRQGSDDQLSKDEFINLIHSVSGK